MTIQTTDRIRSYDFQPMPNRGDCYMEGTVTKIQNGMVHFHCETVVFSGEVVDSDVVGTEVQTAIPGTMRIFEWEGRVTKI